MTECLFLLHFSLQYLTSSQTFSHFLRHVKGRLQTGQILAGRYCFFILITQKDGIVNLVFYTPFQIGHRTLLRVFALLV